MDAYFSAGLGMALIGLMLGATFITWSTLRVIWETRDRDGASVMLAATMVVTILGLWILCLGIVNQIVFGQ
jgi:hypothetical protein